MSHWGHPAGLVCAVAQQRGLAGPGGDTQGEAAQPLSPGSAEGAAPGQQAWPACCWPWGQAARLRQASATCRLSTRRGVGGIESAFREQRGKELETTT